MVHTSETTRLRYFVKLLLEKGQPLMLVGNAGVGKTAFVGDTLSGLSEDYLVSRVPFNYYTTSATLQSKRPSCLYCRNRWSETVKTGPCSPRGRLLSLGFRPSAEASDELLPVTNLGKINFVSAL